MYDKIDQLINQDILYVKKANRGVVIKKLNQPEITINLLLEDLLNQALLKDLTTLEGRIQAISLSYHIYKHIPIYLTNNLILMPTNNKKQIDNIYINSYNIIDMVTKNKDETIIIFFDNSQILINRPYHLIKKYYDISLKIRK